MFNFLEQLRQALTEPLPGVMAHHFMLPPGTLHVSTKPAPTSARQSSVMILLYTSGDEYFVVFIERSNYPGVHSGQVSFPGGSCETWDDSYWDTALRETREELGVETSGIKYLGQLTPVYIEKSNYLVYPQVGYYPGSPVFKPETQEVAEVFQVSFSELFKPANLSSFTRDSDNREVKTPCFNLEGHLVWGATAMILNEFIAVIQPLFMKNFNG